jgi:hypothetical protein
MTDRIYSLRVVLDKDYRDDDVKSISDAIRMIRGVVDVKEHVSDLNSKMASLRALNELRDKVLNSLYPKEDEWLK